MWACHPVNEKQRPTQISSELQKHARSTAPAQQQQRYSTSEARNAQIHIGTPVFCVHSFQLATSPGYEVIHIPKGNLVCLPRLVRRQNMSRLKKARAAPVRTKLVKGANGACERQPIVKLERALIQGMEHYHPFPGTKKGFQYIRRHFPIRAHVGRMGCTRYGSWTTYIPGISH